MSQTRYFMTAAKAEAMRIYALMEQAFEDDGFPLAIMEIDEARDIHEVSVHAEGTDGIEHRIRDALGSDGFGLEIGRETLPDIDWVSKSLEGLKPVRAGGFIVHGAHDRAFVRAGDIPVEIEAGLAFGTGHHGTTAGCLETIAAVLKRSRPRTALDLGTGSGVLAIAIARASRRTAVLATDIDPVATRVAAANVKLNEVARAVVCETATGVSHRTIALAAPFDLIVANILAGPLMKLAPGIARISKPGSFIILSGILDSQRDRVAARYVSQGFRHRRTIHREGWSTILFEA